MRICFASPKVNPKTWESLEGAFDWLRRELMVNNDFTNRFLQPLREKTSRVKDTSELFVRSLQLLELIGSVELGEEN